jgi:hypothetical protein
MLPSNIPNGRTNRDPNIGFKKWQILLHKMGENFRVYKSP